MNVTGSMTVLAGVYMTEWCRRPDATEMQVCTGCEKSVGVVESDLTHALARWLKGARVEETDYEIVASTATRASPVASSDNGNFIVSNIRTIPSPT